MTTILQVCQFSLEKTKYSTTEFYKRSHNLTFHSWLSKQCGAWVPSPGIGLKLDQSLIGYSQKFCTTVAIAYVAGRTNYRLKVFFARLVSHLHHWMTCLAAEDVRFRFWTLLQDKPCRLQGVSTAIDFHIVSLCTQISAFSPNSLFFYSPPNQI